MIILQIKNIIREKSTKWEPQESSGLDEGQSTISFAGDYPYKPEKGSVILSTKLISGEFDNIDHVLLIGSDAQGGRLLSCDKQLLGGYQVEIGFDEIHANGFKLFVQNFIHIGDAIVGLTQSEKEQLNSFETQKTLLSAFADHIIPNRKKQILEFAKPGFICVPNEGTNSHRSHYLGCPNHKKSEIEDGNGNQLYHLATLNLGEFQLSQDWTIDTQKLSFYIRINDSENGWPEEKNDFRVLPSFNLSESENSGSYEDAINFDIRPILDLPKYSHSLINYHKFSDDDIRRYEALKSGFTQLVLGEEIHEEVNKFLGYPDSIQNCVAYEAERLFNKREYSDEIYADAKNWSLLLQISPYCKWFNFFDEFGDASIFFMIRTCDIDCGDFKNCQVVVQNT